MFTSRNYSYDIVRTLNLRFKLSVYVAYTSKRYSTALRYSNYEPAVHM